MVSVKFSRYLRDIVTDLVLISDAGLENLPEEMGTPQAAARSPQLPPQVQPGVMVSFVVTH